MPFKRALFITTAILATLVISFTPVRLLADDTVVVKKESAPNTAAEAQNTPAKDSAKRTPVYDMEKMVVTPTRGAPQSILTVPQSVARIDSSTISSTVYTNANDVVQTVPGVNFAPSSGSGDSSNRNSDYWNSGFSIRGLGAQRALVLTDGVRQSGQGVGYGGGNLSLYDLSSVERIEVLKGPGSVLYGTDSFGGVIEVFTHQPQERDAFGINGRLRSSFDGSRNIASQSGYADVGDKKWGIVVGGAYDEAHLPTLPDDKIAEGGSYTKQSGNVNFVYRPTDDSELKILANVSEARDIKIFDSSSPGLGNFYFKIPFYQRSMFGTEYTQRNVSKYIESWKVGIYRQELKRQFIHATPDFFVGSPPFTDTVITQDTVRTTEFQPQIVFDFAPHTVTVGGDIGYDTTYLPETSDKTGYKLKADANQLREGFYAQDRWQLNEKNILILGGRYDNFDLTDNLTSGDRNTDGASGSVGFTHLFNPSTSVYTTLATGFRSPDLDERYQNTNIKFFNQSVTVQGNPNLTPERSYSIDLGAKKESSFGDFELSGYYNQISDFISTREISRVNIGGGLVNVTQQRQNIGTVDIYGFEAGWKTSRKGPWRNYLNLARSWTDKSQYLALVGLQTNFGLGYQFTGIHPFTKVTPQLNGRFVTKSTDTVYNVKFPAYATADLQLALEWKSFQDTRTQFIFGVKNVFDTQYEAPFYAQPQPGRGLFAALQADF